MAAGRFLGFDLTGNSAIDPPTLKTYPRTKHEVYGITRCGDMAIRVSWGIWNPHFGEGEVIEGQRWHHSKERWSSSSSRYGQTSTSWRLL